MAKVRWDCRRAAIKFASRSPRGHGARISAQDSVDKGRAPQDVIVRAIPSQLDDAAAKVSGHYVNSILAGYEARRNGYDEALLLDTEGFVAEGSGENVFVVRDGVVRTPAAHRRCWRESPATP